MGNCKRHPNTTCLVCGKPVYKRAWQIEKNKGRVFCSAACFGISCRRGTHCLGCGKMILAHSKKKTCSRSCANKLRSGIKYRQNSPRDKVKCYKMLKLRLLDERGQKCERCGYNKYEILQVHHKDHNRTHNDLINLELICPNCHYEEHYLEKSWLRNSGKID